MQDELELPPTADPVRPPQKPASLPLTLETLERILDHREHQARIARSTPTRDYLSLVTWEDLSTFRRELFFRLETIGMILGFALILNLIFVFAIFLVVAGKH